MPQSPTPASSIEELSAKATPVTAEAIFTWLLGEGPDPMEGVWFGDEPQPTFNKRLARFWWRSKLRRLVSVLPATNRGAVIEECAGGADRMAERHASLAHNVSKSDRTRMHSGGIASGAQSLGREIRALAAAPAAGLEGGWQDIASAPKDGTEILIGWRAQEPAGWQTRRAWWDSQFNYEWDEDLQDSAYRAAWTDNAVASFSYEECQAYEPTHWMPLPPAPPRAAEQPTPAVDGGRA